MSTTAPIRSAWRRNLAQTGKIAACLTVALAVVALRPTSASAAAGGDSLEVNQSLSTNQSLFSPHRTYEARMQSDGNLVVYGPSGAIWSSNTRGSNARLVMQGDSNLVIYSDQGTLFATGKARSGSSQLKMQDDGNLVLYGSASVWASKSSSEAAIQWFYNRMGSSAYEHRCETAVENAFGRSGAYLYAAAAPARRPTTYRIQHSNWNQRINHSAYTEAPRGALVFYDTSIDGHVAISLGNGKVVSTAAPGSVIGKPSITYFQRPLGWAWAPW